MRRNDKSRLRWQPDRDEELRRGTTRDELNLSQKPPYVNAGGARRGRRNRRGGRS